MPGSGLDHGRDTTNQDRAMAQPLSRGRGAPRGRRGSAPRRRINRAARGNEDAQSSSSSSKGSPSAEDSSASRSETENVQEDVYLGQAEEEKDPEGAGENTPAGTVGAPSTLIVHTESPTTSTSVQPPSQTTSIQTIGRRLREDTTVDMAPGVNLPRPVWGFNVRPQPMGIVPPTGVEDHVPLSADEAVLCAHAQRRRWTSIMMGRHYPSDPAYPPRVDRSHMSEFITRAIEVDRFLGIRDYVAPERSWLRLFRIQHVCLPVLSDLKVFDVQMTGLAPEVCLALLQTALDEAGYAFENLVPMWGMTFETNGIPSSAVQRVVRDVLTVFRPMVEAWMRAVGRVSYRLLASGSPFQHLSQADFQPEAMEIDYDGSTEDVLMLDAFPHAEEQLSTDLIVRLQFMGVVLGPRPADPAELPSAKRPQLIAFVPGPAPSLPSYSDSSQIIQPGGFSLPSSDHSMPTTYHGGSDTSLPSGDPSQSSMGTVESGTHPVGGYDSLIMVGNTQAQAQSLPLPVMITESLHPQAPEPSPTMVTAEDSATIPRSLNAMSDETRSELEAMRAALQRIQMVHQEEVRRLQNEHMEKEHKARVEADLQAQHQRRREQQHLMEIEQLRQQYQQDAAHFQKTVESERIQIAEAEADKRLEAARRVEQARVQELIEMQTRLKEVQDQYIREQAERAKDRQRLTEHLSQEQSMAVQERERLKAYFQREQEQHRQEILAQISRLQREVDRLSAVQPSTAKDTTFSTDDGDTGTAKGRAMKSAASSRVKSSVSGNLAPQVSSPATRVKVEVAAPTPIPQAASVTPAPVPRSSPQHQQYWYGPPPPGWYPWNSWDRASPSPNVPTSVMESIYADIPTNPPRSADSGIQGVRSSRSTSRISNPAPARPQTPALLVYKVPLPYNYIERFHGSSPLADRKHWWNVFQYSAESCMWNDEEKIRTCCVGLTEVHALGTSN